MLDDMELDESALAQGRPLLGFSYSGTRFPSRLLQQIVLPMRPLLCHIVCFQMLSTYSLHLSVSLMGFFEFTAHNLCLFCAINFTVSTLRGLSISVSATLKLSPLYLSLPLDDNISCNVDFMRGN